MKKYLLAAILLCSNTAYALDSATELMNLGMSAPLAAKVVTIVNTLASPFPNNTFVTFRNAANSANIDVLKMDGTDDTVLNASSGNLIKLAVAGTTEMQLENDQLTFSGAAVQVVPGATSITFRNNADTSNNFIIADAGNVTFRGTMIGTGTADLGWAIVDGTDNVACTTSCVTPAVFGLNLAAGASAPVIVGPADATADICLCAGAT